MDKDEVNRQRLDIRDDPEFISPPYLEEPLYQCATAVTVRGFIPHAKIDIEVDGSIVVSQTAGFPEPSGQSFDLPSELVAGQVVRARQQYGYGLGQSVRAWASLCDDPSPPSLEHITQPPPSPLPTPAFDPVYEGQEQIRITGLANGARFKRYACHRV